MNTRSKILKGARLLKVDEVPQHGDWCRWSMGPRDEWRQIPAGDTFRSGLPVASIRHRHGQTDMQFCTFSK